MQLICLSLSHHNTPLELRERLGLPLGGLAAVISQTSIRCGTFAAIHEMVLISTCNRFELYGVVATGQEDGETPEEAFDLGLAYLVEALQFPAAEFQGYLLRLSAQEVVKHLFQVTAGLDSIAIGEPQILGQVAHAQEEAIHCGCAGHVLAPLFRAAVQTGKRVRTETEIGRRPTSIADLAVQLVEDHLGSLAGREILIIGAGKMAEATLETLTARRIAPIYLTNRSETHVRELADRWCGTLLPYAQVEEALVQADAIFTVTAAPEPILTQAMLARALARREGRPLLIVDQAVPRNVAPEARSLPGLRLFDMDDLQEFACSNLDGRYPDLARAREIVDEAVEEFDLLFQVMPLIGELHRKAEDIRRREVDKTLRRLGSDPDSDVTAQIELLSQSLVRKILHEPTHHLRTEKSPEAINQYVETLARLFELGAECHEEPLEHGGSWSL